MDVQAAVTFVAAHDTPLYTALAAYAVGAASSADVRAVLSPLQQADGSWRGVFPGLPDAPSIAGAWRAMQWYRWLGIESAIEVDHTAAFLAAQQAADGTWAEAHPSSVSQAGMLPGSRMETLWHTAAAARMLVENGRDTTVYIGRALSALNGAWEDGAFFGVGKALHPLWHMLPLFHQAGTRDDAPLVEACHTRLLAAVLFRELDPLDEIAVAHAGLTTRYAGSKLYVAARDAVIGAQQPDGSWPTAYGEDFRVVATVMALLLLQQGGML